MTKADFSDPGNGELFILFRDQIEAGRTVTAVSILHDAQDAVVWGDVKASEYLARLEREAPITDPTRYAVEFATTIRDVALSARLVSAMDGLRERVIAAPVSIPAVKLRDEVDAAITALFSSSADLGLQDVAAVGDRMLERMKITDQEYGRPIGLSFIENLTGPLLPGRLIMLAGASGSGKSALLAQIARYDAERGGTPVLFTREMRAEEVTARLLSSETGVRGEQIERNLINNEEYERLWEANERMRNLRLKISSPSRFAVAFLRARWLRQKKLGGITLGMVDHVHLLQKSDRRMSDGEAINENLEALKAAAMDLEIPVVVACQLSGEALKDLNKWPHRLPIFTDLLYSAAIDRNADVVVIIHRLEHVLKRNEPRKEDDPQRYGDWLVRLEQVRDQVEAILTKRRGGVGEGRQTGYFERDRVRFADKPFRKAAVTREQQDLMDMLP